MVVKISITAEIDENNFEEIKRMEHHAEAITEAYPELENIHVKVEADNYIQNTMPSNTPKFTKKEETVIQKISDLAGDFKCYDNTLSHEETLTLCYLLEELKEFRENGMTVDEIIETVHELENAKCAIEQYQENEKRLISEAATKCDCDYC